MVLNKFKKEVVCKAYEGDIPWGDLCTLNGNIMSITMQGEIYFLYEEEECLQIMLRY